MVIVFRSDSVTTGRRNGSGNGTSIHAGVCADGGGGGRGSVSEKLFSGCSTVMTRSGLNASGDDVGGGGGGGSVGGSVIGGWRGGGRRFGGGMSWVV